MTDHPITPPQELVRQWLTEGHHQDYCSATEHAIAQAARWGADQRGDVNDAKLQEARDQELEGCCDYIGGEGKWFANPEHRLTELRAARRPKPPSLKAQALELVGRNETRTTSLTNADHALDCAWRDGFRAGADAELEACLDEIYRGVGLRIIDHGSHRELFCSDLRAARRPKPLSLKAQAIAVLDDCSGRIDAAHENIIRRALEALDD